MEYSRENLFAQIDEHADKAKKEIDTQMSATKDIINQICGQFEEYTQVLKSSLDESNKRIEHLEQRVVESNEDIKKLTDTIDNRLEEHRLQMERRLAEQRNRCQYVGCETINMAS